MDQMIWKWCEKFSKFSISRWFFLCVCVSECKKKFSGIFPLEKKRTQTILNQMCPMVAILTLTRTKKQQQQNWWIVIDKTNHHHHQWNTNSEKKTKNKNLNKKKNVQTIIILPNGFVIYQENWIELNRIEYSFSIFFFLSQK